MNSIQRGDIVAVTRHTATPATYPAIVTSKRKNYGLYVIGNGFGWRIGEDERFISAAKIGTTGLRRHGDLYDAGRQLQAKPFTFAQMAVPAQEAKRFAHLHRHEIKSIRSDYSDCNVLFTIPS